MSFPSTLLPQAGLGAFVPYPPSDIAYMERRGTESMTTSAPATSIESILVNSGPNYYHVDSHPTAHSGHYVSGSQFEHYPDKYRHRVQGTDMYPVGQDVPKRVSVDSAPYQGEQYIAPRDLSAHGSYYSSYPPPHSSASAYSPRTVATAPHASPQYGQVSSWSHPATSQEEVQRNLSYYPQITSGQQPHEVSRLSDPTPPNYSRSYSTSYNTPHQIQGADVQVARGLPPASAVSYPSVTAQNGSQTSPTAHFPAPRPNGVQETEEPVRNKPQCWQHGCNGRQFSTFSNLLRHQRERAGTAAKSSCPRCGAEFTRTTARNGHVQHAKCRPKRSPEMA